MNQRLADDIREMIERCDLMVRTVSLHYPGDPMPPADFVADIRGRYPMGDLYGAATFLLCAKAELSHVLKNLETKAAEGNGWVERS